MVLSITLRELRVTVELMSQLINLCNQHTNLRIQAHQIISIQDSFQFPTPLSCYLDNFHNRFLSPEFQV